MYLCTYVAVYLCSCVPMYLCAYVPMYLYTYVPVNLCTYVHMYLCTYVPVYLYTYVPIDICTYVWVTCKSWPSARRRPHTIHSTVRIVQFNKLFRSSIWCPLSKIKTNSIQRTQAVTSAHGPNVSQFNFCTGGGQREEKRLAVDRFLRGTWALHVRLDVCGGLVQL
jgi:hypothetical protein